MKPILITSTLGASLVIALALCPIQRFTCSAALRNSPVLVTPKKNIVNWEEELIQGIMRFESFKSDPYRCPAGVLTVGYGHTGKYANQNMTRSRAEEVLRSEIRESRQIVLRNVKVKLTEYQLAALTSFTFNCGEGNLLSLVNGRGRLNHGNYKSIETVMPLYVKADGKTLRGLKHGRGWEVELW
jgi:lysozyme